MTKANNGEIDVKKLHSKRTSGMTRRRLLHLATSSGIAAATALHLTPDDVKAASSDQVPVVIGYTRETPGDVSTEIVAVKENVPLDWYEDLQHAKKVRTKAQFEQRPEVQSVETRPGKIGGRNAEIHVGISQSPKATVSRTVSEAAGDIPESIEGVDINVSESGIPQTGLCTTNDDYDADQGKFVPSGARIQTDTGEGYGTLGGAVFGEYSESPYFITCQHLWYGRNAEGEDIYHPEKSPDNLLGNVSHAKCRWDYAIIEPADHVPTRHVIDTNTTITGHYSTTGIENLAANGAEVKKKGQKTCSTAGPLKAADGYLGYVEGGCDDRTHQVKWGCCGDFDDGDSGSLAYHEWTAGEGWAVCLNAAADPLANGRVVGTSAPKIHTETGSSYTWF